MFKKLLIPVDLSDLETAKLAIDRATLIARASEGSIHLVHVRSDFPVTWREFMPPTFDTHQREECKEKLETLTARIDLPQERISSAVCLGAVHAETIKEAERIGADLIIVGSHQPSNATYLLGSSATTIVRHARCSVLVVRP